MVYSIDSMHLNYGHVYYAFFSSASCVQQRIIPNRLNQIYIAAHRWKEEILSFLMLYKQICHLYQILEVDRSSTCERKCALGINTVSLISIDKSTLGMHRSPHQIKIG